MAVRVARDYQSALRLFALRGRRVNWWAGTGTGKTSSALDVFDTLWRFGEIDRVLIVSTKRVCKLVWPKEVRKWENFEHHDVAVAVGDRDQRLNALRRNARITTINYDMLPWLVETIGEHWPWRMVIADESSKLKNLRVDLRKHHISGKEFSRNGGGSSRAGALSGMAHAKVNWWINMTGTPMGNSLTDLWGQQWFIDGGARLGRSFKAFEERWFRQIKTGQDAWSYRLEPTMYAEEQIKQAISDCTITIEAKDYFDLPQTIVNRVYVPLGERAYSIYREMEREYFIEVSGHEIEAVSAGSKSMKCRQIASGAAYVQDDPGNDTAPWIEIHDAKIEALADIIDEAGGEPVIVAFYFKSDLARLKKAFPKGVFFDDKQSTLNRFVAGKIQILFVHPMSAAHGIDEMQQACRTVIWFSMIWNLEEFHQLNERVGATRQAQAGLNREVRIHLLIGENTIEEEMVDRVESKASAQDAVKAAMKKRGYQ